MTASTTYHARKAAGLCVSCGGTPVPGLTKCQPCRDRFAEYTRRHEELHPGSHTSKRRRRAGLCACGAVPEEGFAACAGCRARDVEKQRRYAERKRQAGLCPCGASLKDGERGCAGCREKRRKVMAARKARGDCMKCGGRADAGRSHCRTCRAALSARARDRSREFRRLVFDHYGRSCRCCGCAVPEFLSIDHVNGGGTKHRKSLGGKSGTNFYGWLVRRGYPEGYQTLCHSCNMAKGFHGRCPCQDWTDQRIRDSAGTLSVF